MKESNFNIGRNIIMHSDNNKIYKNNTDLEYNSSSSVSTTGTADQLPDISGISTKLNTGTAMDKSNEFFDIHRSGNDRDLNNREKKNIGNVSNLRIDDSIVERKHKNILWDPEKTNELLMNNHTVHQNSEQFPYKLKNGNIQTLVSAKYDYQIIPGDERYKKMQLLEDKLKTARASLGLQVHGNNNIAKAMKYYSYNRFKVPDTNLAFNKMTTHVFFTRPDLNILTYAGNGIVGTANAQVRHSTDASMIWQLNPSLFKLLTNCNRCGDSNNFNMLLSQQISSWEIPDDELQVTESGKTYNGYSVSYGETWNGKQGQVLNCTFDELSDLSIINLLRLWLIYIDNVSNGAWSPSYNLKGYGINTHDHTASHVYMKALDYAASAYVFKCDPTGENVIYWEKYYGIFPTKSGASSLGWNKNDTIGTKPTLTIPFKYSWRLPMSAVSLIEFNKEANLVGEMIRYSPSYNPNFNHSSRPYVGCPYLEFDFSDNHLKNNGVDYGTKNSYIKLKFRKDLEGIPSDDVLYKQTK